MPKARHPLWPVLRVVAKTCTAFAQNRGTSKAMRLVFFAVFALGCGAPPTPATGMSGAAGLVARPAPPPPSSQATASALAAPPITLVPLEAPAVPASLPHLEVLQPAFGDTLDPRFARRQPIQIRAETDWLTADAQGVLVSLDGGRPRRVLPDSALVLGDLLPADQELTVGPHVLLLLAVAADGRAIRTAAGAPIRPVATVGFFVGPRTGDPQGPASPQLYCLSPTGTHYVRPGAALNFEVVALGFEPKTLALNVRGDGLDFSTSFEPNRSYAVYGLPVGDVLLSAGGTPGPRATCVATVNPEPAERAK